MSLSNIILYHLINDQEYCKQVSPYIKSEYFETEAERKVFTKISDYILKYHLPPTIDAVLIDLSDEKGINERTMADIDKLIDVIRGPMERQSFEWLRDKTEQFCKERAVFNGLAKSIRLMEEKKNTNEILEIFRVALSVSFDDNIGHDYFKNAEERWIDYNKKENKIPFRIDYLNKITDGGIVKKTLSLIYAGVHVGKSAHMCSLAADNLLNGNNVLYVSCEMAEEAIGIRIDAKLMDINIGDVKRLNKEHYLKKIGSIQSKTMGKLIIKQYPTGTCSTAHLRRLLDDLKLKSNFVPDVIYIDYLNICASERIKIGSNVNSYTVMKHVSEELRGLAVERDVAIYTASQFTRGASTSSDPGMNDVSESFGISMTGDFIYAIIASEDLIGRELVLIKQLKNRYSNMNSLLKFFLKFDRGKMSFTDAEEAEKGTDDVKDASMFIEDDKHGEKFANEFLTDFGGEKKDFGDFKF